MLQISEINHTIDYVKYSELMNQLSEFDYTKINHDEYMRHLDKIINNPLHKIYVATINEHVVGSVTILIEPKIIHNLSNVAHIEDVVVDSNYRGMKISTELINTAIEFAKEMNCYKIILNCSDKYVKFYERHDFIKKDNGMAIYISE